jgi:antitoxin component of MazEF toxin-antitoxin module
MLFAMGYQSKVQVIERARGNRQFYLMCPAQLAEALELEKGEEIEWVVEDKQTLVIRRRKRERRREAGLHER